jgi:hypothetical protein
VAPDLDEARLAPSASLDAEGDAARVDPEGPTAAPQPHLALSPSQRSVQLELWQLYCLGRSEECRIERARRGADDGAKGGPPLWITRMPVLVVALGEERVEGVGEAARGRRGGEEGGEKGGGCDELRVHGGRSLLGV